MLGVKALDAIFEHAILGNQVPRKKDVARTLTVRPHRALRQANAS